ncbi:MAG: hypothetical protein ACJAW4_003552 [Paracoccaceae bacterium]
MIKRPNSVDPDGFATVTLEHAVAPQWQWGRP